MGRFIGERVLRGLLTIFVTLTVVFLLIRMAPGDPASILAGSMDMDEAFVESLRQAWGLNEPTWKQFLVYIKNLFTGNLGYSYQYLTHGKPNQLVIDLIMQRLPRTFILAGSVILFSIIIAIPLGTICAMKPGSWFDNLVFSVQMVITSIPNFYIGMILIAVLAVEWKLLPTGGYGSIESFIMPMLCLSFRYVVSFTRTTRTELGQILSSDYLRTAKAKGLSGTVVLFKHGLRNVMIPIVTMIGTRLGGLLTGAVYVETLFRYYGVGELLISAISARDYPTIQAVIPYIAAVFVVVNLLVDMTYFALDPRIRKK